MLITAVLCFSTKKFLKIKNSDFYLLLLFGLAYAIVVVNVSILFNTSCPWRVSIIMMGCSGTKYVLPSGPTTALSRSHF
eukprot:UN03375